VKSNSGRDGIAAYGTTKRETAMEKNCLNCMYGEVVHECQTEGGQKPMIRTGKAYSRCGLDRELRVNERMHCEAWKKLK
jgi:hypothetical protein